MRILYTSLYMRSVHTVQCILCCTLNLYMLYSVYFIDMRSVHTVQCILCCTLNLYMLYSVYFIVYEICTSCTVYTVLHMRSMHTVQCSVVYSTVYM